MTAKLDKSIKRELELDGKIYTIAIAPDGLKVTEKGRRNGQELSWRSIISGDASLNESLKASVDSTSEPSVVFVRRIDRVRRRRPALIERPAADGAVRRRTSEPQLGLRRRQRLRRPPRAASSDAESAGTAPARADSRAARARACSNSSRTSRGRCVAVRFRSSAVIRIGSSARQRDLDLARDTRESATAHRRRCAGDPSALSHRPSVLRENSDVASLSPEITDVANAIGHRIHRNVGRIEIILDFVPRQRRRDGRSGLRANGVNAGDGLSANVLQKVDVDRAASVAPSSSARPSRSSDTARRRASRRAPRSIRAHRSEPVRRAAERCECRWRRMSSARRASPTLIEHFLHRAARLRRPARTARAVPGRDR